MTNGFGTLGLAIGIFFSISPFPTLYTAFTKDSKVIQSISTQGTVSGIACCMMIGCFCAIHGFLECYLSCGLGVISCTCCLVSICYFNKNYGLLVKTYGILLVICYCIVFVFSTEVTDMLILVINTVSSVAGAFETTDSLLKSRDPCFMHVQMHTLGFLSCLIWGLDYVVKGSTVMVFANAAGVSCEIVAFIAY